MGVFLKNRVYSGLYYPDFFPIRKVDSLSYETLIGSMGNRIAADVTAYNASAPEKSRKVVDRLTGQIPPTRMKKIMRETDINLYNQLKARGITDVDRLMDLVFGDVEACVDGVNGRLEWLTLQALSKAQISLSTTNNAGVITQKAIDFQMPSANKEVEAAAAQYWTTGAYTTNTPITDIETIVAEAKAAGSIIKRIFMNQTKWIAFRTSTQVQDMFNFAFFVGGTQVRRAPTLKQANESLADYGLPQITVIDTSVSLETADHVISAVDPWLDADSADRFVLFTPELPLGEMLVGPIAEETNPPKQMSQAKKGHILVSKWSTGDPVSELTKGETNAFPSFTKVDMCWNLDTESHTTWDA